MVVAVRDDDGTVPYEETQHVESVSPLERGNGIGEEFGEVRRISYYCDVHRPEVDPERGTELGGEPVECRTRVAGEATRRGDGRSQPAWSWDDAHEHRPHQETVTMPRSADPTPIGGRAVRFAKDVLHGHDTRQ
jgi:hypothetical protein